MFTERTEPPTKKAKEKAEEEEDETAVTRRLAHNAMDRILGVRAAQQD
jgi:hypothetical protein